MYTPKTGGGYANLCGWPWAQQPAVAPFGTNFELTDSDIWATYAVLYSQTTVIATMPDGSIRAFSDATFGHIRGNTFRNGGACHWFDGIQQLIFDDNRCIGNSPMAGGSNVATYSGGYSHHLYLGDSSYEHVYGNDRETVTYDDAGSTYFGSFVRVSGSSAAASGPAVLETPGGNFSTVGGPKRNTEYNFGKAVIVANGTGADQYRRVVSWRWSNNPNVPSRWVLDRPFDISPEPHAWVAIVTFRGENIFERNRYTDVGAFQFYGVGINNIASELIGWGASSPAGARARMRLSRRESPPARSLSCTNQTSSTSGSTSRSRKGSGQTIAKGRLASTRSTRLVTRCKGSRRPTRLAWSGRTRKAGATCSTGEFTTTGT